MKLTRRCFTSTSFYSFIATLLLLSAYLWPAFQRSVMTFSLADVLANMLTSLLTPTLFWWQLGYYLFMVLLVHFLFFYLLAEVVRIKFTGRERVSRTLVIWLAGTLFLQTINSGFFPHSAQAFELATVFSLNRVMPWAAAILLALLLLMGAGHLWLRGYRRWGKKVALLSLLLALMMGGMSLVNWVTSGPQHALAADKPNIILIGVDALRPDQLAYMHAYDKGYKSPMPFLDQQLAQSVVFTQAYTTVARTYPSWMAMLTGQDPLHSGVRFNLQDDYGWWHDKTLTLPQYLKQQDYQTLWAIDETSFANVDHRQGFDKLVQPEPGAAFFLVNAMLADVPLVSVLSNSRYGHVLFPLTSSNRGLGFAYYPSTFSERLRRAVKQTDRNKPLFMAVHFEMAHYPSIWADDDAPPYVVDIYNRWDVGIRFYRYDLSRANQQVEELMQDLRQNGRLDNAIVVFLSDHGNGFFTGGMGKDRFGKPVYVGDESTGHGTDITNLSQQHTLLAIRGFGQYALPPGYRDNVVSLMDITPTLLWTLGIPSKEPMQGVPLDVLGTAPKHRRTVYFESGFYLEGLGSGKLNLARYLPDSVRSYRINTSGRLVLRKEKLSHWYGLKNRAAFDGRYMLVHMWKAKDRHQIVAGIDAETGEKFNIDAKALRLPGFAELGYDFCQYYGTNDPDFILPAFCQSIVAK